MVPKPVTLNDLDWRNELKSALFHRIRGPLRERGWR